MTKRLSRCLWALALAPALAHADPLLSGRVRELGGIEPVLGARVSVEGLSVSARTDAWGRYRLSLPLGWARLQVSADDFGGGTLALTVSAGTDRLPDVYLRRSVIQAETVLVRARREDAVSRTPIQRAEIRRIAGIGRDPLRALQTLPGVVTPSDFSGQMAVRGGGPQDNRYLLNEIPWPVPFHFGGALSTVHSDLLERVDLYPAAFPAKWGGVDGAILDAHSRAPKRDALHGQLDVNLLLTELLVEGPFGPGSASEPVAAPQAASPSAQAVSPTALIETPAPPKPIGAWLVSGRRSYFDLLLKNLGGRFTAIPRFWDVSVLGDVDLGEHDQLRFTALSTDDRLALELKPEDVANKQFQGQFSLHTYFGSAGLNWTHQGDGWRSVLTPYTNVLHMEQSLGQGYGISQHPFVVGLKQDLSLEQGIHAWGAGYGVEHQRYDVFGYFFRRSTGSGSGSSTLSDPAGLTISADATTASAYLQDRLRLARGLHLSLGGRWQRADRMVTESFDPRVGLDWEATPSTRFSAGWGLYSQFPTPRELSDDFGNPQLGFIRTEHIVAGVEQRLGALASIKVEGYYKAYRDRVIEVSSADLYSNDGEGIARGVELMLKREGNGRWFGWISYSLAESLRLDKGGDWADYQYDQPNTLTLVGSYSLNPAWSLGTKVNWHSGPLITPVIGRTVDNSPDSNTGWLPVYGAAYSERLDDYIRVDLRSDYAFRFRGWRLNFYAEIINLFGRPNPAGVTYNNDYSKRENVDNLPFLPYIGLGAEF